MFSLPLKYLPLLCLSIIAALFFSCGLISLEGGSGSTTTNGIITGLFIDSTGNPAADVAVRLLPYDFNPVKDATLPDSLTVTTAKSGAYSFSAPRNKIYNLQARENVTGFSALVTGIAPRDDTTRVAATALAATGAIKVSLPSKGIDPVTGYIFAPGTAVCAFLDKGTDTVVLGPVPAGTLPLILYGSTNAPGSIPLRYNVPVSSGDTTVVCNPSWKYSRLISLNTTPTGADVAGTVVNFPVLVRLAGDNFDFSQAQLSGADLRFAKADNTFLPYEIERWDPAGKQAELWVKVDTLRGNDSVQTITMYWGNPAAADSSSSASVFDTTAGFQGVWHLGESAGNLHDATGHGFNGGRNGSQIRTPGEIGYGQNYDGSGDFTEMGNVCNPDTSGFTVCAWIKPSSLKSYRAIMSKSLGDSPSPSYGWLIELGPDGALSAFIATGSGSWGDVLTFVLASRSYILDTVAWHHIAVVIDRSGNNKCKLYIDGSVVTVTSVGGDITDIGPIVNSAPMRLGSDAKGGCPWKGALDECSIAFTPRSPDWVKLCYSNQKTDGKLVFFRTDKN